MCVYICTHTHTPVGVKPYLDTMLKLYSNYSSDKVLKLCDVLYPNICGSDISSAKIGLEDPELKTLHVCTVNEYTVQYIHSFIVPNCTPIPQC